MTRQQVARLLGKSVASVRRIEGVLLHPEQESKGIWRFDLDEVEQLAADVQRGDISIWEALSGDRIGSHADGQSSALCCECVALRKHLGDLESRLASVGREHARALEQLEGQWAAERSASQTQARLLENEAAELVIEVENLLR